MVKSAVAEFAFRTGIAAIRNRSPETALALALVRVAYKEAANVLDPEMLGAILAEPPQQFPKVPAKVPSGLMSEPSLLMLRSLIDKILTTRVELRIAGQLQDRFRISHLLNDLSEATRLMILTLEEQGDYVAD